MSARRLLAAVSILATIACCSDAGAMTELTCASPEAQVQLQGGAARLRVASDGSRSAPLVLEISESGMAVTLESDAEMRSLPVPPRLGISLLRGTGQFEVQLRLRDGHKSGQVRARLECDGERATRAWNWLAPASTLADTLTRGVGSLDVADTAPLIESLADSAYDARSQAWAKHLRAQALLMGGQARDAADAFIVAEAAWRAAGESLRAKAALVAAAEDLNRTGQFSEVLQLTEPATAELPSSANYYEVRLRNAGCLALRYTGRLDDAGACYSQTTQRLLELGESVELAVTSMDFGTIELDRGKLDSAIDLFRRSLELAVGPKLDDERGRAEFFLADAQARGGQLAESVAHLQRAMSHFERSGSTRWLGSSLMRLGGLLSELGATEDARAAVLRGLAYFDEINAPARVAAGELALARIALRARKPGDAREAAERARSIYQRLSMPVETTVAEEMLLRALVDSGDWQAAKAASDAMDALTPGRESRETTRVELDLGRGELDTAERRLQRIEQAALALGDRWRLQRAQVALRLARGERAAALNLLRVHRDGWLRLAQRAGGAVLRERLEQFAADHAAHAIDIVAGGLLQAGDSEPIRGADDLLMWLSVPATDSGGPATGREIDHQGVDRQLAAALFPTVVTSPGAGAATQRALLDALLPSERSAVAVGDSPPAQLRMADLRARLEPADTALVLLDGQHHVLLVQLSAHETTIRVVADRAVLLKEIEALDRLQQRPDSATSEIRAAVQRLGEQLSLPGGMAQSSGTVYVLPSGALARIAWPLVLEWHEEGASQRRVSLLVPRAHVANIASPVPAATVEVLVASQSGTDALASLEGARREASYIRAAEPAAKLGVKGSATRQDVLSGLANAGSWVHIAAHGTLAPGRIGGAGLWLDPPGEDEVPDYLSWLEILDRGVASPLVVLNACQLGSEGRGDHGLIGFSTALMRAGAGQVVAAYWPTSDSASAVWVKAFYQAALQSRASPGDALAEARSALRRSRAFRHPYYWAGLTHFETIAPSERIAVAR